MLVLQVAPSIPDTASEASQNDMAAQLLLRGPEPYLGSTPRSSTPSTQISRPPRKLTRDEPMRVAIAASSSSRVSRPSSNST